MKVDILKQTSIVLETNNNYITYWVRYISSYKLIVSIIKSNSGKAKPQKAQGFPYMLKLLQRSVT